MAYAELAGLPAITGLYTSILCLLGYAFFGPSRILVLGPDSSLGPMIAATHPPAGRRGRGPAAGRRARLGARADGRGDHPARRASAKLGFVADLISKPTMIGYMNGLAVTILVGQLPEALRLLGRRATASSTSYAASSAGLADGETVPAALAVGLVGLS